MKKLILFFIIATTYHSVHAYSPQSIRMHCPEDTTKIEQLLALGEKSGLKGPCELISFYGEQLLGTPYVGGTLEGKEEMLTINIDQLDCTTFVETLTALARCTMGNRTSWRDYASFLENIRYKGGEMNGYPSRLHYISAWIIDNTARGNVTEMTRDFECSRYETKTLDFMTRHRDKYDALKDSANYAGIKNTEIGYYSHRYSIIRKSSLKSKKVKQQLKDGEIVAITTKTDGLDVSHMGIIKKTGDEVYLLHASMTGGKVEISPVPIDELLRGWRSCTGIRVIRLKE